MKKKNTGSIESNQGHRAKPESNFEDGSQHENTEKRARKHAAAGPTQTTRSPFWLLKPKRSLQLEPTSTEFTTRENVIQDRIQANIQRGELNVVITVCYGCGKCFYGDAFLLNSMFFYHNIHHRWIAGNANGSAAQALVQEPESC